MEGQQDGVILMVMMMMLVAMTMTIITKPMMVAMVMVGVERWVGGASLHSVRSLELCPSNHH